MLCNCIINTSLVRTRNQMFLTTAGMMIDVVLIVDYLSIVLVAFLLLEDIALFLTKLPKFILETKTSSLYV